MDAEERLQVLESTGKAIELLKGSKKEHKQGISALLKLTGKKEVTIYAPTPRASFPRFLSLSLYLALFLLFALFRTRLGLTFDSSTWILRARNGWISRAEP